MTLPNLSRSKAIISLIILLSLLSAGVFSWQAMDHQAASHHGCLGLSVNLPPCTNLVDLASCLQVHLGVWQAVSRAIPPTTLLLLVVILATAWFVWKCRDPDLSNFSRLYCRRQKFKDKATSFDKIWQWLARHEKRDPAATILVVLEVLPVPIR